MKFTIKHWTLIYFGLTIAHLIVLFFGWNSAHMFIKPLFMPILMLMLHQLAVNKKDGFYRLMQFGLLFSWFGDIALMIDRSSVLLFIAGLSFFLIAHIGYTLAFVGTIRSSKTPIKALNVGIATAIFALFAVSFFSQLNREILADMLVPVLAYTAVICTMGAVATLRQGHTDSRNYLLILAGAIVFIFSDCVIAWNKFVIDFPYDDVLNMSLYLSGQFLLAFGTLKYLENRHRSE